MDNFSYLKLESLIERKDTKTKSVFKRCIKKLDFFCKNEIEMSLLIKTIPLYKYYFNPNISYKEIKLKEIDEVDKVDEVKYINEIEIFNKENELIQNDKYMLLLYDSNNIQFNLFFKNINNENKRINCIYNSYNNLLKIIELLNENNIIIINFDILFKYDNSCIISNFSHAFVNYNINEERRIILNKYFFNKYEPKNISMPIDYHILCFMNENNIKALSRSNINKIIGHFSNINNYINDETQEIDNNIYYTFINKSYNDVFIEILKNSNSWNLYQIQFLKKKLKSKTLLYQKI